MSTIREEVSIGSVWVDRAPGPWPVLWSAVWVGALASVALVLIFGLLGIAIGAHAAIPPRGDASWRQMGFGSLILSVLGAFLAFAAGGWIAGKIVSARRAEVTMLHAAVSWLVSLPILLVLATFGSAVFFGSWYSGLAGVPSWVATSGPAVVTPEAVAMARTAAVGALSALLLGLVGAIVGGWMASGEPMTLTYYRTRDRGRSAYPATI